MSSPSRDTPVRGPVRAGLLATVVVIVCASVTYESPLTATPQAGDPAVAPVDEVAAEAPSSQAVRARYLAAGQWLVSLVISDESLNDPARGILANPEGRGREWEREGWLSMYDGTELAFATKVGVRLQGSSGRTSGREAFRFHFRREYGLARIPPGGPLKTMARRPDQMIVRQPQTMPHTQPMAFEIARRIGAVAPAATSVRFVLNGSLRPRAYELTEHVSREGWGESFFGHDDFLFYQFRGDRSPADEEGYRKLRDWVAGTPEPMRVEQAAERIDVDNLIRHALTIIYCGTSDWAQGAAVLETRSPQSRWFWVLWDLDQSFWQNSDTPWQRPSMRLLTAPARPNERTDLRAILLQRLLREDPAFARRFAAEVAETLNHRLTPEFLRDLVTRYQALHVREAPFRDMNLQAYFDHRADVVFDAVASALGQPRPHEVRVDARTGTRLEIDGHERESPYVGRYFDGQTVTVRAIGGDATARGTWQVNGGPAAGGGSAESVRVQVDADTRISLVE